MTYRRFLSALAALLVLAALAAIAWSAPRDQGGPTLTTPHSGTLNLPDILKADLSANVQVFNAEVYVLAADNTKDFNGCIAWVKPQGQTQFVWVISPDHRVQTALELAAAKNKPARISGRKYASPPEFEAWLGMDVYLGEQAAVEL